MKKIFSTVCCVLLLQTIYGQNLDYSKYDVVFCEPFDYAPNDGVYPSHQFKNQSGYIPTSLSGSTQGHGIRDFWSLSNGTWGAGNEFYSEDNVILQSPGVIRLTETAVSNPYQITHGGNPRDIHYHAGYLRLNPDYLDETRNYGYGIVEARIRFPDQQPPGSEICPIAVWLWGHRDTEIDIFDHSDFGNLFPKIWDNSYNPVQMQFDHVQQPQLPSSLGSSFHTFSAEWTPSTVRYYIDGQLISNIDYEIVRTYPFFYALELAIMPSLPDAPNQFMEIDWVKIWSRSCEGDDLDVNVALGLDDFFKPHPPSGRLFRHQNVTISAPSLLTLIDYVPTVIRAEATTINSTFLADQSSAVYSTVQLHNGPQTHLSNAYFEITPVECVAAEPIDCNDDGSEGEAGGGDGPYDGESKGLAVKKHTSSGCKIYPNPTSGSFTVELPERGKYDIVVTNVVGSVVHRSNISDQQKTTVQLGNELPPGNYILRVTGSGVNHVEKITLTR